MRKQRAFAGLTEREIEQIADWLRSGGPASTYDAIRERIAKPRPEGFALTISNKPLQLLWEKTNRVERINNRIASGQRLTLAEFDAIQAGEKADLPEQIHDAIMDETHAMATSGENTPTQLLALQRLADFPARAEYREHKRQLELRQEEFNLRKEERDQQKQAHKIQMDLQKSAHKIQMDLEKAAQKKAMDEHRKLMAEERLALAKRSLELREKQLQARLASDQKSAIRNPQSAMSDDLGPLASTLDEIEARATKKFCLPPLPPNHTRNPTPTQNPLSETPDSDATAESQTSANANSTKSSEPSSVPFVPSLPAVPSAVRNSPVSPLASLPLVEQSAVRNIRNPQLVESLEARVSAYTLARHHEAAHGKNPLIVGKYAAWNFKTKMQWCPCGNQHLPCPEHGDFPKYFWELSPDSADYTAVLRAKKLPFISHYQLLRDQEEQQQQQAAAQSIPLSPSLPSLPSSETSSETLSAPVNTQPSHEVARQSCCSDPAGDRLVNNVVPFSQSGGPNETNETTASAVFEATDNEQPTLTSPIT